MADKIKKYIGSRQIHANRMSELHQLAVQSKADESLHSQFVQRFKSIEETYEEFEKLHKAITEILCTIENSNLVENDKVRSEFDNLYYSVKGIYADLFETKPQVLAQNANVDPVSHSKIRVHLPEIKLIKFSGDIKTFSSFIEVFNALIHNNSALSNVEKFSHLHSCLDGPPKNLISCLPLSNDNYITAYSNLINRYTNKRYLATAHYNELKNCPSVSSENPHSLRILLDIFSENLAALKNLKYNPANWDFPLVQLIFEKLDETTISRFELNYASSEMPSYETVIQFLDKQSTAYETILLSSQSSLSKKGKVKPYVPNRITNNHFNQRQSSAYFTSTTNTVCPLCKGNHLLFKCSSFLTKSPQERYNFVKQNRNCVNCLSQTHNSKQCNSQVNCHNCNKRHHTLLHFNNQSSNDPSNPTNVNNCNNFPSANRNVADSLENSPSSSQINRIASTNLAHRVKGLHLDVKQTNILLSTVQLHILDFTGNYQIIRGLIDCGSQACFLSKQCANKLGLKPYQLSLSVQGLGQMQTNLSSAVQCSIKPIDNLTPVYNIEAVILENVCSQLPSSYISIENWSHISNLKLADTQFNKPGPIDILLGAEVFSQILKEGRITSNNKNLPTAIETVFGFVLMGNVENNISPQINSFFTSVECQTLDDTLKTFWEIEEVPHKKFISAEDELCENIFIKTHTRTNTGRYMVNLPFKHSEPFFEGSREIALRRFFSIERRLLSNPQLRKDYSAFIHDYIENNHCELILDETLQDCNTFYIPHHPVFNPHSTTTKLRVVFDGSAKCYNNISLNDTLLSGPKLQQNIVTLLLDFRIHKIVFTADIKQHFRNILVNPIHRDYQRILWRFNPDDPIQEYRLNTVTYGLVSSPYLAIRTLLQLAEDENSNFSSAAQILTTNFYVDDAIFGCSNKIEAHTLKTNLIKLLRKGGFELKKWTCNYPELLSDLPEDYLYKNSLCFDSNSDTTKILGLNWNSNSDCFSYSIDTINKTCTKRSILSDLARIFDPLGFLTPVTFLAKFIIQHLWALGLGWDDTPPDNILKLWTRLKSELPQLSDLQIQRYIFNNISYISCELHGFSDASEKGTSATVYFRIFENNKIFTALICAKSKVAPLKRLSICRLELVASVLLANLMTVVLETYRNKIKFSNIYAWTDSSVVLSWLKSSPHRWKTFVANRVALIQDKIAPSNWHHISTLHNPADAASRGLMPSELLNHTQWWVGPDWLSLPNNQWPSPIFDSHPTTREEEKPFALATFVTLNIFEILVTNYSSLEKIKRIVAYILRFINNIRTKKRTTGFFTIQELHSALIVLIKHFQYLHFSDEISLIKKDKLTSKSLRKLNPFLDDNNILRVGGRLNYSKLSYDKRFPILLPKCRLTDLIIENYHQQFLHCGLQTLQFLLSQQFWILSARRSIRKIIHKCHNCWRLNPKPLQPPMGNLPAVRISQIKCFSKTGTDFAGPFNVTLRKMRGAKSYKAYVCLFICMATKAVHIELTSDLSTESFLNALRRFVARRGRCSELYSDNGTNFAGANNYLSKIMETAAATEKIKWHFNPPLASHMGGLWESNIRSIKTHLLRVIGSQILTYEELSTVLVQIEAVLNSRPLCPASSDPNDCSVLTPGHFLTLEPLSTIPEPDPSYSNLTHLTRWQLLQRLHFDFWSRWHKEYLHTLHQRAKWHNPAETLLPDSLVLLKTDNAHPLHWQTARVIQLHYGQDNVARVATVRTKNGLLKRPLVKICPLPNC